MNSASVKINFHSLLKVGFATVNNILRNTKGLPQTDYNLGTEWGKLFCFGENIWPSLCSDCLCLRQLQEQSCLLMGNRT